MEIAKSYDSMPYPSKFFVQTHPDRLATLANLFGVNAKTPEKCRLLELGCGNGSNLISHAYNLQDARFVGVDISGKHIEQAEEWANSLNLTNIEFHEIDVVEMNTETFGKFDYITAHGLISWIPDFVRQRVFELFTELLEPNGIGYISYNTYPGAHRRDMVRRMMRFHTADTDDPVKKVQKAISFLSFLTENAAGDEIYKPTLESELHRHFQHETGDIYHDDLAEFYHPYYFQEFAEVLEAHQLQFLAETEFHAMSMQGLSPDTVNFLSGIDNLIEREQYLDFFRGRSFRQSLICHQDVDIERSIEPDNLDELLIASSLKPEDDNYNPTEKKIEKFKGNKGFGIEIDHPLTKTALILLYQAWGGAIELQTLLQEARRTLIQNGYSTDDLDQQMDTTKSILFQIYQGSDLIEVHTHRPKAPQKLSEKPKINDLARWQIGIGDTVTTLFGLNMLLDDEVSKHLLELLDGTRDRSALVEQITNFIKTNDDIDENDFPLDNLGNWLESTLFNLAKLGLFVS
jgi:methyltransferase-like protein/2-polyprenyl-3-methyl-5-hydroxy-6-metoxy-1,4-benzoquinol methylase